VDAHLTGVFPRSEKLVAATRAAVRGNLPQAEVDQVLVEDAKSLIILERQSALDEFVDGQLNWQDLFRPFSEIFTGVEPGGLTRWFDNNTFYRRPVVTEKVTFKGSGLHRYFRTDLLPKDLKKKAILPGPLTFALLSEDKVYQTSSDLVADIANSLRSTVKELQGMGYQHFQFNDPCICAANRTKSELKTAKNAYEICAQGKGILQTYFGDASLVIDDLLDFPVDAIGIDFYSTRLEQLEGHDFNKTLGCGCLDGRNSLLELPSQLEDIVQNARQVLEPRGIYLAPNCDLEFLPHSVAERKIRLLGETKRLLA
jgi:5-methyltetrahydropteroyltriglutamate--homocysteine methyltransferase